eukprot:4786823-Prymnesium_polylepis.1
MQNCYPVGHCAGRNVATVERWFSRPPRRNVRRQRRRAKSHDEIAISILCTACRPTLHQVRKSSTLPSSTGHKVDLNVRKPSASCPVG